LEEPADSIFRVDGSSSKILYKPTWLQIPDLSPCDLFSALEQALKCPSSLSDECIKTTELQRFEQQPREFFAQECQWDTYLNAHDDHF
jgi:hypothetical protein